ncbi:hypothetical protein [Xylella fastidiosa]|uniref:hypothetical protein n=1 Tax=Xylella fastidiosa TaxID=2371 RepID=UPI00111FC5BC|nr:hypothetical protein [Xylella fastidiosa]TNW23181.1 hypothetical protein EIP73_10120 [Xylella fastidiosa subsp. pauca]
MNYNRNSNDSRVILLIVAIIGAIILLVWGFSALLGLDMQSGTSLLLGLLSVIALSIALFYFFDGWEVIFLTWPILLASAWACFWPALNYWSSQTLFGHFDTPWWATWYTKGGVLFAIIGLGYLINKIFEDF